MPCFLAFSRAPSQAFLENSWSAAISAAVNGFGFCAAATSKNDEDLALWYHGHHGRRRRHRGVGPDDEIDLVDLEQLGVDARHRARRTLIVVVDELDRPPEQAALGVGLLLPDLHAEQRLLAVRRQRASQRHGEADLDRLPGLRLGPGRHQEQGHSGPGKERDDRASRFQSCKHGVLRLAIPYASGLITELWNVCVRRSRHHCNLFGIYSPHAASTTKSSLEQRSI